MERNTNEKSSFKSTALACLAALVLATTFTGCATAPADGGEMLHVDQGTGADS